MSLPESAFPLNFDPFLDESGLGYCLRVVSRNGANLHALRRLLGISATTQFNGVHAPALAAVFHASQSWLQKALAESGGLAHGTRNYRGHVVYAHNHLRLKHPQVCPQCIRQGGYCRAVWDLSMSTICLDHGCSLINRCTKCRQILRWDRPSIDVGHCGHYIQSPLKRDAIAPELVEWQKILEDLFARTKRTTSGLAPQWANLIRTMSLGGACILIAAFGCMERPLMAIHTGQSVKTSSPLEWQTMALRAIERIQSLESGLTSGQDLSAVVAQPTLLRLLHTHGDSADHQIAMSLMSRIFDVQPDRRMRGLYPNLGQLSLF